MINHNFFHSLVLHLATDFFPPLICNFCCSHLFHMDFPFFSFCISPRQAICILSANLEQSWRTDMISPKMSVCISLQDNITFFTSYHRAHLQHRRKFWRENDTFKPLSQYFCYLIVIHEGWKYFYIASCAIFFAHISTLKHSYNHKIAGRPVGFGRLSTSIFFSHHIIDFLILYD